MTDNTSVSICRALHQAAKHLKDALDVVGKEKRALKQLYCGLADISAPLLNAIQCSVNTDDPKISAAIEATLQMLVADWKDCTYVVYKHLLLPWKSRLMHPLDVHGLLERATHSLNCCRVELSFTRKLNSTATDELDTAAQEAVVEAKAVVQRLQDLVDAPVGEPKVVLVRVHAYRVAQELTKTMTDDKKKATAGALWSLADNTVEGFVALAKAGGVQLVVDLLSMGSEEVKKNAATAIFDLAQQDPCKSGFKRLTKTLGVRYTDVPSTWAVMLEVMFASGSGKDVEGNTQKLAEAGAITQLANLLASANSPVAVREVAAQALWSLATGNRSVKKTIGKQGIIPHLIQLLKAEATPDNLRREVAGLVQVLSCQPNSNKRAIAKAGGVLVMLQLVHSQVQDVRELAVGTLGNLTIKKYKQYRKEMVAAGAIPVFVGLLNQPDGRDTKAGAGEVAAVALLHLMAYSKHNRRAVVAAGGLPLLVQLMGNPSDDARKYAAAALQNMTTGFEVRLRKEVGRSGAIPAALELLRSEREDLRLQGLQLLRNLAVCAPENVKLMRQHGADRAVEALLKCEQHKEVLKQAKYLLTASNLARDQCTGFGMM